uniref:Major facilitator superfamily (MFS) profile domain-containing protein n=1 Tax=Timema monikensis TaxID=170555 RepID=A0A7R9E5Y8_9NEOP|nr:unnamed protein product [Timema monikensis]
MGETPDDYIISLGSFEASNETNVIVLSDVGRVRIPNKNFGDIVIRRTSASQCVLNYFRAQDKHKSDLHKAPSSTSALVANAGSHPIQPSSIQMHLRYHWGTDKEILCALGLWGLSLGGSSANGGDGLGPMYFFWRRRRYMVAMLAFFGFFNVYALRVNFSVAIVAMTSNRTVEENGTIVEYGPEFDWDSKTQGLLLSSFFFGYICTQILGGWLASRIGGNKVYGIGIAATSILTIVMPAVTYFPDHAVIPMIILVRVVEGLFEHKGTRLSRTCYSAVCDIDEEQGYFGPVTALSVTETRSKKSMAFYPALFQGVTYPCIHAVWARWAPPLERSRMASLAFAGSYVGTVVSLPVCGVLANELGWPSIFYVFGVVGLIWFIIWMYVVKEGPEMDPKISPQELEYLQNILGQTDKSVFTLGAEKVLANREVDLRESTHTSREMGHTLNLVHPWRAFFTSMPVWAVIVAHFCENWGFYTLLTQLPTFMKDALEFNLKKAGFMSALPYLVMAIVLSFSGQLADYLITNKYLNTSQINCERYEALTGGFSAKQWMDRVSGMGSHKLAAEVFSGYYGLAQHMARKLFTCSAFMGQAVFMLMTCFLLTPTGAVSCLTAAVGLGAFAWSGFSVNHLDIAPQHASVLMGLSNTVATLPGIISPSITGILVQNKTVDEWRVVFYMASFIYLFGALFYGVFSSGEIQPWAEHKNNQDRTKIDDK